jgi:septal ring factor EnvC (AmiA/AmiB activator)
MQAVTGGYFARRALAVMTLCMGLALAGCDYWPPALQAQIEQLRQDAQIASTERLKLESQLMDARKDRDQLQARLDELSRSNQALSAELNKLEQSLNAERDKVAKLSKGGPKVAAKAPAKSGTHGSKAIAKKKTTKRKA